VRLYEHEAKQVFAAAGISVPRGYGMIRSVAELDRLEMDFPVMLKAVVLTGGRGKAGGIRKAANQDEARSIAAELLGLTIGGYPVEALFVEEAVAFTGACYLGVTMSPVDFDLVVMASPAGGVDIEQVSRETPDAVRRLTVPGNPRELDADTCAELAAFLADATGDAPEGLGRTIAALYRLFQEHDCRLAEINPLLLTPRGVVAADAKVVLDDNALYRQWRLFETLGLTAARHDVAEPSPDELRARQAGFPYVDLLPEDAVKDPDKLYVGLVPGGAGYGIFSIDETANIGERFFGGKVVPVNFMDSGGGPTLERVAEMFHLLMDKPLVDVVITSRFGGISSCDIFIRGLVQCLRERHERGSRVLPVVGRMVGTDLPRARAYLEEAQGETPEPLRDLDITVGNEVIMAEIIRKGIERGLARKESRS
jgi:succinyl-CoA synthetase beta subunit